MILSSVIQAPFPGLCVCVWKSFLFFFSLLDPSVSCSDAEAEGEETLEED